MNCHPVTPGPHRGFFGVPLACQIAKILSSFSVNAIPSRHRTGLPPCVERVSKTYAAILSESPRKRFWRPSKRAIPIPFQNAMETEPFRGVFSVRSRNPSAPIICGTLGSLFRTPLSRVSGACWTGTETVPRKGFGNPCGNTPKPYRRKAAETVPKRGWVPTVETYRYVLRLSCW